MNIRHLHEACFHGHTEVARTLISIYGADVMNTLDFKNDTPLHVAAYGGASDTIRMLVREFDLTLDVKGFEGRTPLHSACQKGKMEVVDVILQEFGFTVDVRDEKKNTPLHLACSFGHTKVARALISKYGADVKALDFNNNTPLHLAAIGGASDTIRMLVREFDLTLDVKGFKGRTPLHKACEKGKIEVVDVILQEFGFTVDARDEKKNTPLHLACSFGHTEVARALISKYGADVKALDFNNNTPLHLAAICGTSDTIRMLVREFDLTLDVKGFKGRTPLHSACANGKMEVVNIILQEFGFTVDVRNESKSTLLHLACEFGHTKVARALISKYGADVKALDFNNSTPLHLAAIGGASDTIRMLVREFDLTLNVKGFQGRTPLHNACEKGKMEVVDVILQEFGFTVDARDEKKNTPLHLACSFGHTEVARALISKYGADLKALNFQNNTPLHVAAIGGASDTIRMLVREFDLTLDVKGFKGRTPLHIACQRGYGEMVRALVSLSSLVVYVSDDGGNTALHTAAKYGHSHIVRHLLLESKALPFARNADGDSPMDVMTSSAVKNVFHSFLKEMQHTIRLMYDELESLSRQKSCVGSMTRIFVVGHAGAGKSTLIEALKRKSGFFQSLFSKRLSDNDVPLHTAGIIPSFHSSEVFGNVLFYDFAGDAEYHSSHAAVLEKLMHSGRNIFLLVADISKSPVLEQIKFWLSFISFHSKNSDNPSQLLLVGNHADVVLASETNPQIMLDKIENEGAKFCQQTSTIHFEGVMSFDCCLARDVRAKKLHETLKSLHKPFTHKDLSCGASILLGLLHRDFSEVVTSPMHKLSEHIKTTGIHLPTESTQLIVLLKELQNIGLLLMVGKSSDTDHLWIIFNLSKLTHNVHEKLFSRAAQDSLLSDRGHHIETMLKFGILPAAELHRICPQFINKECLIELQYCHDIPEVDFLPNCLIQEIDHSHTSPRERTSSSLLFFPALMQQKKEGIKWAIRDDHLCCKGWYCVVSNQLPPRFLHVLLLRLAFCPELTRSLPAITTLNTPYHASHVPEGVNEEVVLITESEESTLRVNCHIWRWGIRWSTELGVECLVEVTRDSRGIVVISRSSQEHEHSCSSLFLKVIQKVLEAKVEFCHSLSLKTYLINPEELSMTPPTQLDVSTLPLYRMSDVKRVLKEGLPSVVSSDGYGERILSASKLSFLLHFTMWSEYSNVTIIIIIVYE